MPFAVSSKSLKSADFAVQVLRIQAAHCSDCRLLLMFSFECTSLECAYVVQLNNLYDEYDEMNSMNMMVHDGFA